MPEPGSTLEQVGPYTVESEIGRGGMGVVYLATDSRLDRKVAIKALPEHFAMDPERLARFEREAKILASLSHSNIAAVYGLEEQNGARYLVMEYVEGESLQALIQRGPLAVDEALRIAVQVASGMESAHDAGVIHRDLKPGNVVVTLQGAAKVLDFGLAKEIEGRGSSLDLSRSPTATIRTAPSHHTAQGQVVGTAAYLSPEQARGKALDKRTDIWAFGCVLYEMLTGASPYAGETMTDSLGAILHKDPDWSLLPPETPATIQLLLRRCLAKDPNRRLRDIGDARVEIEEALRDPSGTSLNLAGAVLSPARRTVASRIGWIVAAIFAAVAAALGARALLAPAPDSPRPIRLTIQRGTDLARTGDPGAEFALSPDESMLAFCAGDSTSSQLFVRSLDQFDAMPLSGTRGATSPFFSPDGQWIGFFADNKLKKVAVTGGAPLTLCDANGESRGGSWGDSGMIAFTPDTTTGIWLVSSTGGQPTQLTTPSEESNERSHRWPHFLPGSEAILFVSQVRSNSFDDGAIEAVTVADGARKILNHGGSGPKYAASGHLLFGRAATLYASPFDAESLKVLAPPKPVLEGVAAESSSGGVEYALSETGALLFAKGESERIGRKLQWADRSGVRTYLSDASFMSTAAQLSPQGDRIAMQIFNDASAFDIWIFEIARSALSRLTFDSAGEMNPIWSPDGQQVIYSSSRSGPPSIYAQRADGSDSPRLLSGDPDHASFSTSWSSDGSHIAFMRESESSGWDAYTLDLTEENAEAKPLLTSRFDEIYPVFSPDGRWIAYASDETGRSEIYVRSFPISGGRWQVSIDGGTFPVWAPDGSELFFWGGNAIHSASVLTEGDSFRADSPVTLFEHSLTDDFFYPKYSVSDESQRFLLLSRSDGQDEVDDPSLSLVLNWFTELNERVGDGR